MIDSSHFEGHPEGWAGRAMPGPGWAARHPENDGKLGNPAKTSIWAKIHASGGLLAGRGVFPSDDFLAPHNILRLARGQFAPGFILSVDHIAEAPQE